MKTWLPPLLGLCVVSSCFAAVGESKVEVEKRYGQPVISIPLAAPFKGVTVMNYEFKGMYVAVAFLDGKVVQEHYMKRDEAAAFTKEEVTELLGAHGQGKSWLEKSESTTAPQFTATNGPFRRLLLLWIARAANSFPVPLSPRTSAGASVGAIREMDSNTFFIRGFSPTMPCPRLTSCES